MVKRKLFSIYLLLSVGMLLLSACKKEETNPNGNNNNNNQVPVDPRDQYLGNYQGVDSSFFVFTGDFQGVSSFSIDVSKNSSTGDSLFIYGLLGKYDPAYGLLSNNVLTFPQQYVGTTCQYGLHNATLEFTASGFEYDILVNGQSHHLGYGTKQ